LINDVLAFILTHEFSQSCVAVVSPAHREGPGEQASICAGALPNSQGQPTILGSLFTSFKDLIRSKAWIEMSEAGGTALKEHPFVKTDCTFLAL